MKPNPAKPGGASALALAFAAFFCPFPRCFRLRFRTIAEHHVRDSVKLNGRLHAMSLR